jgi:HSP20 family protein
MITFYPDPFKEVFDTLFENPRLRKTSTIQTKVSKNDDDYKVIMPVPGLTKEDLTIKIKDGVLKISYETKDEVSSHSFVSSFQKSYRIPDDVDEKHIRGCVENGVLEISLPKSRKKNTERLIELS